MIRMDLCGGLAQYDNFLHSLVHNMFVTLRISHSVLLSGLLYLLRFRFFIDKHKYSLRRKLDCDSQPLTFVLFLAAMTLSSKFHLDSTTFTRRWSDCSGVSLNTINHAERVILEVIEYRLSITKSTFDDWISFLFSPNSLHSYQRSTCDRDTKLISEPKLRNKRSAHSLQEMIVNFDLITAPRSKAMCFQ